MNICSSVDISITQNFIVVKRKMRWEGKLLFTVIRNVGATVGRPVILRRKITSPQVIKRCFPMGNPEIVNNFRRTGNARPYNGVGIYSRKQQFITPTSA